MGGVTASIYSDRATPYNRVTPCKWPVDWRSAHPGNISIRKLGARADFATSYPALSTPFQVRGLADTMSRVCWG